MTSQCQIDTCQVSVFEYKSGGRNYKQDKSQFFFLTAVKLRRKTKVKEFSDNEMKKTMRKKLTLEMPHQKTMVTIFATIKRQTRMK